MNTMDRLKKTLRVLIRPFYKIIFYELRKGSLNVSRNGEPLKMGITAVVAMKNEEYTLPFCLKGLVGFADQVVIIDNGSQDNSLDLAKEFKKEFGHLILVDILEMPGALLGDCREAGLRATKYQWHLRWDADMIAHTDGEFNMKKLRIKILADKTPRTIQLPRMNRSGDLFHVHKNKEWDPGEPILMWFNKDIEYKEFGKFDTVRVPKYYRQIKEHTNYYLHCSGLKSDINLIHRFHYFTWRESYNLYNDSNRPKYIESYETFVKERNSFLFNVTESDNVKYRYKRQFVQNLIRTNSLQTEDYPEVLREEVKKNEPRFHIIYRNNQIFSRIDRQDIETCNYTPNEDDINWNPDDFFNKLSMEKH